MSWLTTTASVLLPLLLLLLTCGFRTRHCFSPLFAQVRAVADLLPELDVVEGDPFNSSPTDPKLMGPDALARFRAGEKLPSVRFRTPLVGAICQHIQNVQQLC